MEQWMKTLADYNDVVNTFVWTTIGLVLLLGTGLLTTVATRFFQVTHIGHWMKQTLGSLFARTSRHKDASSISPFAALCTALAATIGVGNIAGVAAAIVTGGPGAVFWMWVAAFFGMMTNYSENVLGIYFRRRNGQGEWSGGAMYYLQDGLAKNKFGKVAGRVLAILFSIFTLLASFGIGAMGQVNKIVVNIEAAFPVKTLSDVELYSGVTLYSALIGLVLVALAAVIVFGGLKRIAAFAERIVPFMVVLFLAGSLIIIGVNYGNIWPAIRSIFVTAFNPSAIAGGALGITVKAALTAGFKRGVFSNEAGLGSSVMVHSNSSVREPVKQGMWGIFEVFADTMVVCTMTALVILTSGVYNLETGTAVGADATLVANAFNLVFGFGNVGARFVAIAIFLFAFTTALGWSHYGTKAWEYLFGTKSTPVYKVIHLLAIFAGAMLTSSLAWDISDTFNGLMMIPNLIGVVCLTGLVAKITRNYLDRRVRHKDVRPMLSVFDNIQAEGEAILAQDGE